MNGYTGIDLDNVVSNNKINDFALYIVNQLNSYTEYSPSGNGLHILCKNSFNIGSRNDKLGIEIYSHSRFFTITGNTYGTIKLIEERTEEVKNIYDLYMGKPNNKVINKSTNIIIPEDDDELFNTMFNNESIKNLFNGDISKYNNDDSRADLALCNYLAYYTNGNIERIDRMFRKSSLMREKWEEKRGMITYGMMTIEKALNGYNNNIISYNNNMIDKIDKQDCILDYLEKDYEKELISFENSFYSTGFKNIDENIKGLYPALYVLAAQPSMGKTTFALQLADQIAQSGKPIIYFSLEQSRRELVSKSISRITKQKFNECISSIDISQYCGTEVFQKSINYYKTFAQNIQIITNEDNVINIEVIKSKVENYIQRYNKTPTIFVDYLQIISNQNKTNDIKEKVDENIKELKSFQDKNKLIMFLISSINRQSYNNLIDLDSLKETGSIEYTANVIWGLQLKIMSENNFIKKTSEEKKEIIKREKGNLPRKIELICLKNRAGTCPYSCNFNYYADYDYFEPYDNDINSNNKPRKTV